jgi:two-component system, NarL family, sensor kinase
VSSLALAVRDDGVGFDGHRTFEHVAVRGGLGLLGMRERVERFGGTIEVRSAPGQGTYVRASFSMVESASDEVDIQSDSGTSLP